MDKKNGEKMKIQDELLHFFEGVMVPYMDNMKGELKGEISELRGEISEIKVDISKMKVDINELKEEVRDLKVEVMYIKNDVRDLKTDTPTAREFQDHEVRIGKLEKVALAS